MQTHYELLGIPSNADTASIKRAWRHLARLYHPDRNVGDPEAVARFQAVVLAYHSLIDPERRRSYDSSLGVVVTSPVTARASGDAAGGPARKAKIPDRAICVGVSYGMNVNGGVLRIVAPGVGRCRTCGGTGRADGRPCAPCEASGHEHPTRTYPVPVAPGLLDGGMIRIPNAGWPTDSAGRGDLVVQLTLEEPPEMRRDGTTVFSTARITRSLAFTGGPVSAPAPDGTVEFRIPARTLDGARFSFPGRGLRSGPASPRGELIVTLRVA